jgi:hypothetical protein
MSASFDSYDIALNKFVRDNHSHLSLLYGAPPEQVSSEDIKIMLGYTADLELRAVFEFKGRLAQEALFEIRKIPAEQRTLETAAKAIAHHEVGQILNKPLSKARDALPAYGKALSSYVVEWRTKKMRATFRKLIDATMEVDNRTAALLDAARGYRDLPTLQNKVRVQVAIKGLNKSLLSAHFHAKAGAAWSLRAGYTGIKAARAVDTVYIQKVTKLAGKLEKLDSWLSEKGISSKMSEGIIRRKKILNRELMLANADPSLNEEMLDNAEKRSIKSFEHGTPNYA